jgi:hypothetical protein
LAHSDQIVPYNHIKCFTPDKVGHVTKALAYQHTLIGRWEQAVTVVLEPLHQGIASDEMWIKRDVGPGRRGRKPEDEGWWGGYHC